MPGRRPDSDRESRLLFPRIRHRAARQSLLDEIGYAGWIGCEYRPKAETKAGLGWASRYGIAG